MRQHRGLGLVPDERRSGGQALLGSSDAVGAEVERLQFELGEGPCWTAFTEDRPVLITDLADVEAVAAWPVFTAQAAEAGLGARGLFAFPLRTGSAGLGVLDCYRSAAGPLEDVSGALLLTDVVTLVLLDAQFGLSEAAGHAGSEGGDADLAGGARLDPAWRVHAEVHQATGVLAVQLGIDTDTALARLRGHAFRARRPLAEVADDVLAGRLHLTEKE